MASALVRSLSRLCTVHDVIPMEPPSPLDLCFPLSLLARGLAAEDGSHASPAEPVFVNTIAHLPPVVTHRCWVSGHVHGTVPRRQHAQRGRVCAAELYRPVSLRRRDVLCGATACTSLCGVVDSRPLTCVLSASAPCPALVAVSKLPVFFRSSRVTLLSVCALLYSKRLLASERA